MSEVSRAGREGDMGDHRSLRRMAHHGWAGTMPTGGAETTRMVRVGAGVGQQHVMALQVVRSKVSHLPRM